MHSSDAITKPEGISAFRTKLLRHSLQNFNDFQFLEFAVGNHIKISHVVNTDCL